MPDHPIAQHETAAPRLVQVNQNLVVQANLSYGGAKSSGLGKETSVESMLEHFTHKNTVMVNWG
jgi:aldehyde dehydrogenase (NAD+)